MADFGEFENTNAENAAPAAEEVDPAAEFLAREQDQLAGIEDDNLGGDSTPADTENDFLGGEGIYLCVEVYIVIPRQLNLEAKCALSSFKVSELVEPIRVDSKKHEQRQFLVA